MKMYFDMEQKPACDVALQTETGEVFTYGELREQIAEFQHAVRRRSFVFLLCENSPGAVIGYLGCLNAGAVPLLLNAQMDTGLLQEMYEHYRPEYVWMPEECQWKPYALWDAEKMERSESDHVYNGTAPLQKTAYRIFYENHGYQLCETGAEPCEMYPDLALLLATSGSTGSPKLVRLSRENLESNARAIAEYLHLTKSERAITSLPMQYTYGLSVLNSHFQSGACVLLTKSSVVQQEFWKFFERAGGTSLVGVPYTYELLRRLHLFDSRTQNDRDVAWFRSLRYMTQAGGRLSENLQMQIGTWAKEHGVDFVIMYGQTEATARMSYLPADQCLDKIGSIGIAIPGGRFYLEDADKTTGVGELIYEGENVSLGMAECREDLKKADERHGVLHTGDLARTDEDGFYYIAGRKKRFLKIFGNRVGLDECEQILQKVYAETDSEFACVGTDDHLRVYLTEETLVDKAAELLAERLHISERAIRAVYIPELPKNAAGKVLYHILMQMQ